MKLLVQQLAIPLSNQNTVAKWLVIAIRLNPQAGKSLVIAVLTRTVATAALTGLTSQAKLACAETWSFHRRSLCVAVDAKHRVPHGIPLAGTAALFRLRIETGIGYS
jgi:hypothetical protein